VGDSIIRHAGGKATTDYCLPGATVEFLNKEIHSILTNDQSVTQVSVHGYMSYVIRLLFSSY